MEFHSGLNLMLEALAYLGRRAAGYDAQWMVERLRNRSVEHLEQIEELISPIGKLMEYLDESVAADAKTLDHLFGNLPGFAYNTIGTYSRGFLLLYPLVSRFRGDWEEIRQAAKNRPPERLAGDLAMMLDMAEEATARTELTGDEFTARVLAMPVPAQSKVAVLELYHDGGGVIDQAMDLAARAAECLSRQQELMEQCCAPFVREVGESGLEAVLAKTSALNSRPERKDVVSPFLFGMDTLLALTPGAGEPVRVYCGILRLPLQKALESARGPEYEVYNTIKLLADRTRFDILCYLRTHEAYGQELAAKFGLSRNTIHHHMTKLLAAHLVKCTVDGNRVYYRVDAEAVERLLDRQRGLLLPEK